MLDLSFVKIAVLMALAVMIFGPEKVPVLIADALRLLRNLQAFARTGTDELKKTLGPEFADLRPQDLHPKALMTRAVTGAIPELGELGQELRSTVHPVQQALREHHDPDIPSAPGPGPGTASAPSTATMPAADRVAAR
ncbi:hypothetical protein OG455_03425 [Kitasatospora sp. NBC_01287]|uniref:hypothetical protein n=1 Tax=Kitasatospora sp. NBC_01287 TaxID=2903573 RepID=UPI00225316B1|nr:hypothetical protein [Kitasatospora sp. NBC_01287]MCX4744580.1 hypothetical protein [Kitasatospora sp. NBC_01287]